MDLLWRSCETKTTALSLGINLLPRCCVLFFVFFNVQQTEWCGCWGELCLVLGSVSGVSVPWHTSLSCLHIQMKPVIQSGPTWTGLYESVVGETKTFMWWIYNVKCGRQCKEFSLLNRWRGSELPGALGLAGLSTECRRKKKSAHWEPAVWVWPLQSVHWII